MRKSGIVGVFLVATITVLCIVMGGGNYFFNVPSLMIIVLPCAGLGMMVHGKDFFHALRSICVLFTNPTSHLPIQDHAGVFRNTIIHVYAMGAIGTMIGWIQMLVNCKDMTSVPLGFGVSILTVFYSLLICELLLRPAAQRIEWQCKTIEESQNH
jgi:flagellar motor component MotA